VSPRSAAAAVARTTAGTIHAPRPRPAPPRRRSGATTRPRTQTGRARTAPRGGALPHGNFIAVLDRLLRGPVYIATVGILLVGIVFFNVDVLELNHGIASTDSRAAQLKRDNAALTLELAKLGSSERIQRLALAAGLVLPQPGDVRYLRAHRQDAGRALRVMTAPDSSGAAAAVPTSVTQASQQQIAPPQGVSQTTAPPQTTPVQTAPVGGQTPAGATAQPASTTGQTPPATTPTTPAATPPAGQ
jgi:cell division protein FtsL